MSYRNVFLLYINAHIQYIYCLQVHMFTSLQSYTIQDEVVNPLSLRKCTVLKRVVWFDLRDILHERNPNVK